ncbi:MAG TPA: nuclear transport factor 2 family protein [Pyrinomonadaceae bacterium]|nr:nuclear transport factor 2 family protein [Pyrinomonadaceae bacterium]
MKKILILTVFAIAASWVALGQTPQKPATQEKPAGEKVAGSSVESSLMQIEQELLDALLKGDASANERYLADSFTFIAPNGMVSDKAQGIADIKSGDLKFESSKVDDMKVRVYGDTAVVTYITTDKGTYKGQDISGQYRWTDVFVKQGGKWQIVAGQGTPIMKPAQ